MSSSLILTHAPPASFAVRARKPTLILLCGLALLLSAKYAIVSPAHGAVIALFALAPLLLYVALRRPLVFPYALFVFAVPFDPLFTFTGGPGTTITRYLAFAVDAALIVRIILLRRAFTPPKSWYPWGATVLLMFGSAMWSINVDATLSLCQIMLQLFAMFTLLATYPLRRSEFWFVTRLIVATGTLASLYGLYAYATGRQRLDATRLSVGTEHMHLDPNHYAAFFFIPAALLVAFFLYERRLWVRIALAACFVPVTLNVLLTGSRGGLVGLGLIVLYVAIRSRRYIASAVMALACGGLLLAFPTSLQRFADPTQGEGSGRNELWTVGLAVIKHDGLWGAGFGTFPDAYNKYFLSAYQRLFQGWDRPAHNLVIQSWVELGIFGLALVLWAWYASWRQNASIERRDVFFPMRLASEGAILALFAEALTIDMLWYKYLWVALTFSVLLSNAHRPRVLWTPRGATLPPPDT